MSSITRRARTIYVFVARNLNLVKRCWAWEAAWMVYSIVNALPIALVGQTSAAGAGQVVAQTEIGRIIFYLLLAALGWHYLAAIPDGQEDVREEPVFGHVL
jgi:hypothetical protein